MSTIIIGALVLTALAFAARKAYKNRKDNGCGCGGGCSGCNCGGSRQIDPRGEKDR